MYKLIKNQVRSLIDGTYIPFSDGNTDYEKYKLWLAEGNTPEPEFTEEELAQNAQDLLNKEVKAIKESNLATITVTTEAGNTFDGNDKAINRMMAAIQASAITGITETKWVLADNSNVMVTLDELKEALVLSIQAIGNEVIE